MLTLLFFLVLGMFALILLVGLFDIGRSYEDKRHRKILEAIKRNLQANSKNRDE